MGLICVESYIDSTKYTGTLASANLLMTTNFYAVNSTSALINGQTVGNSAIKQMNIGSFMPFTRQFNHLAYYDVSS
jgi:hypothetical protein